MAAEPHRSAENTLSIDEIARIAKTVEAGHGGDVAIRMVSSEGGTCRVEMLVTKPGCSREPCVSLLSMNRDRSEFERDLRDAVSDAIQTRLR